MRQIELDKIQHFLSLFLFIYCFPGVRADNEEIFIPIFIIIFIVGTCLLICKRIYERTKPVGWILEANRIENEQGYDSTRVHYPTGSHLPPREPRLPPINPYMPSMQVQLPPEPVSPPLADPPPPYETCVRQDIYNPVATIPPPYTNPGSTDNHGHR